MGHSSTALCFVQRCAVPGSNNGSTAAPSPAYITRVSYLHLSAYTLDLPTPWI